MDACAVPDCDSRSSKLMARGLCPKHYEVDRVRRKPTPPCDQCGAEVAARRKDHDGRPLCNACQLRWRNYGRFDYLPRYREVADRFWEKVDRRGPDECWPWLASLSGEYGQFAWDPGRGGRIFKAHRAAWILTHDEEIPEGMTLDHTCLNTTCVNPAHLEVVTRGENSTRRLLRAWAELAALRTENAALRAELEALKERRG